MEEERYVIRYDLDYNECLIDTEEKQGVGDIFKVVNLLNQQDNRIKELKQENQQLKHQLEEKEKELAEYADINNTLNSGLQEKCILCEEEHNQDKISFAIEQLEKVKELMRSIDMPNKPELYNNDMFGAGFDSHYIRVEELIDNQINELKGNAENEKCIK